MAEPRIGWLSHHVEGVAPLIGLLDAGAPIVAVITLREDLLVQRSGAAGFAGIAAAHGLPLHRISNVNNDASLTLWRDLKLDALFVIGWSQILHAPTLACFPLGCFGAHASLLPANRGSAPINWALIKGEKVTGNTLMRLGTEVDAGDIVAQRAFAISPHDNANSLYAKVADTNLDMLLSVARDIAAGRPVVATRQAHVDAELLPRRRPEHGVIDWRWSAAKLYDFVRALTRPYPGATARVDGASYRVWHVSPLPIDERLSEPGTVIGSVPSDVPGKSAVMIACGTGAVLLHELQDEAGAVISDRALADRFRPGMMWQVEENALDVF